MTQNDFSIEYNGRQLGADYEINKMIMEHKVIRGKTLGAWKKYAEDEYHYTPMQVVKYIVILEEELSKLHQDAVIKSVCDCERCEEIYRIDVYKCGKCHLKAPI